MAYRLGFMKLLLQPLFLALAVVAAAGTSEEACPRTVTATTTSGVSLVQAASSRARFNSQRLREEKEVTRNVSEQANTSASGNQSEEEHRGAPCFLNTAIEAASSFVQRGHTLGRSTLSRFNLFNRQSGKAGFSTQASTGALLFALLFLIIIGGFAFVITFRPGAIGGISSFDDPDKSGDLRSSSANLKTGSRMFFPTATSPQLSIRGASRYSPEAKRLPEVSKISPGSKPLLLARGLDLSSDDEKVARRSSARPSAEAQFCPDLVVPEHCECILVLPLDLGAPRSNFSITDVNGSPVLCAVPQQPMDGRPWRATITTANGDSLVQCIEARNMGAGEEAEFHLLRGGGKLFGKLIYSVQQDRYLLTLTSGAVLHFWGNFDNSAVNLTDDDNRLLGTTEIGSADFDRMGTYCRLRVAPLADVGLALCGLLCIAQHMKEKARRSMKF